MAEVIDHRITQVFEWIRSHAESLDLSQGIQFVSITSPRPTDSRSIRCLFGPGQKADLMRHFLGAQLGESVHVLNLDDQSAHETTVESMTELGENQCIIARPTSAFHSGGLAGLLEVVQALLEPETGCPWDLEQTHESLKKFLLEESYELFQAIDSGDTQAMCEELGDVLLQPLMHARMAEKEGKFDGIQMVAQRTADKLVRRHPHVFGNDRFASSEEVLKNWEAVKKQERSNSEKRSMLDGVPKALPSLSRAMAISQRVARVGFEWPSLDAVYEKLHEEVSELQQAEQVSLPGEIESEIGDVLFTLVQVARWHNLDAEDALRKMIERFTDRFQYIESNAAQPLAELSADEWQRLWDQAKARSK